MYGMILLYKLIIRFYTNRTYVKVDKIAYKIAYKIEE
jgi:hypothetical protein